jgi:hypothetical protein
MLLGHIDPFHQQVGGSGAMRYDTPLALVLTGDDDDLVAFTNLVHE